MTRIRYHREDWEEWLRPHVVERSYQRPKNQYAKEKIVSTYFAVERVPFRQMLERGMEKYLKWTVVGQCQKCKKEFVSLWNNMWIRKAFKGKEICGRCARKEQFTDEWKTHNSEAQLRVQGTPEARQRMSETLKDSWAKNPERRIRMSQSLRKRYDGNLELRQKIGEASRRNWRRLEYQERVTGHGYYHGYFLSRYGRIYFASSWELMFLVWCEEQSSITWFGRCNDVIRYEKPNKGIACYHPDFQFERDEQDEVVEVKGGRSDIDLVERKRQAAIRYYQGKKTYTILYKSDLQRMGIFRQNKTIQNWIDDLAAKGKVDNYGCGKKH